MNPHLVSPAEGQPSFPGIESGAEWLRRAAYGEPLRIVSIGPEGTSAHGVLTELGRHFGETEHASLGVALAPSFGAVMEEVLRGTANFALVPSAYRDATAFHWHPDIELAYVFVHQTPEYGLAARPGEELGGSGNIVVAAMSEVEDIFEQLAPPHIVGAPIQHRRVSSTSQAAAEVQSGAADIAVCNRLGRDEHGLAWIGSRVGAEMVWMLFRRAGG